MVDTGVEQDALGGGGLAGIDVRHDADIADLVEVGKHVQCHGYSLVLVLAPPVTYSAFGPEARRSGPQGLG
ncbi:hypothetical protein GCM10009636_09350 [Arthrobacter koreensis]